MLRLCCLMLLLCTGLVGCEPMTGVAHAQSKSAAAEKIEWDALMPKNWDPFADLKKLDLNKLSDADPRAMEALEKIRASFANAPVVPEVNGKVVRIAGYIVPLEQSKQGLKEFLLVPYFGACIHVPPPPPNQVIHVKLDKPRKHFQTMDTVWVQGKLTVARAQTGMGEAGYRIEADSLTAYKLQP
ncbi:MAG: hypothetical protein RIR70_233 [Pseudomonadota bacterium]